MLGWSRHGGAVGTRLSADAARLPVMTAQPMAPDPGEAYQVIRLPAIRLAFSSKYSAPACEHTVRAVLSNSISQRAK